MATWSQEMLLLFIEKYRALEVLWKTESKDYHNRYMREQAYAELVTFCSAFNVHVNKDFILRKISNIKATFSREYKKHIRSKSSESERVYEPKLWYFNDLLFLKDQRSTTSELDNSTLQCEDNISRSDSTDNEEPPSNPTDLSIIITQKQKQEPQESLELELDCEPVPNEMPAPRMRVEPPPPKRKKAAYYDFADDEDDDNYDVIDAPRARQPFPPPPPPSSVTADDQHDAFGKNIAHKLRHLPREQRIFAEKVIFDALFEAQLGTLSRNSTVVTKPPPCMSSTKTCDATSSKCW